MILTADSGSTKTDWLLGDESGARHAAGRFQTEGINPIHQSDEEIACVLRQAVAKVAECMQAMADKGAERALSVLFYGSGVRSDQEERMCRLLREAFTPHPSPFTLHHIEAHSDLLGAARALCGSSEGLACILGTGANSCLYDGEHIVANIPPMGYILGDEGSGAVLGRLFLNALYKGRIGSEVREAFEHEQRLTLGEVIDRVYRRPLPNRWLASLSPFIHGHLGDPAVAALVAGNFDDFIARNIEPYGRRDLPLNAVGSIAFFYRDQLCEAAAKRGYAVGKILRSPLG